MNLELTEIINESKKLRWNIHKEPELGYNEEKTTEKIEKFFNDKGILFNRFDNMYGGYVYIDTKSDLTVGFRADIDALPILENTGLENSSKNFGVMHACGHDMHTSIAAGLALYLWNHKNDLNINVVILFQPAEECSPKGGAKPLIESGFIEKLRINAMYGLHVWPSLKVGQIAVKEGVLMASSDKLTIDIKGVKSHAAEPHRGVDAISIAADIINAVVHKLRREIDPFDTSLVTIGKVETTGRYNVLCGDAKLEGTIRATTREAQKKYHKRIVEVSEGIANSYCGKAIVKIEPGYHILSNDEKQTSKFISFAKNFLGKDNVKDKINPSLIGEDFSFYTEIVPSTYFFLGCESDYPLHSDCFCPKEEAIDIALNLLTKLFTNIKEI